ncbi:MAG: DUF3352 domain-containing protein [Solirubrobacterales bacterium]
MLRTTLASRARRATLAACAGVVAVGLAACGGGGSSGDANPAAAVPATAPLYIQATLRPDGELKTNTENVLKKILKTDDPGAKIVQGLESGEGDVSFKDDIDPWLGDSAGIFFTSFSGTNPVGAAVIASQDNDKAQSFIDEQTKGGQSKSYNDTDYRLDDGTAVGIVGDYVVAGTERGFRTVVDTVKGDNVETMSDNDQYNSALSTVGESDALGTLYVSTNGLIDALARSGGVPADTLNGIRQAVAQAGGRATVAKLGVTSNAIVTDSATIGVKQSANAPEAGNAAAALAALPGDSWLGFGASSIGERLRSTLAQFTQLGSVAGEDVSGQLDAVQQQLGIDFEQDLFRWMGDGGLFVRGTSIAEIGGALVVQSSDPQATSSAIRKIARLVPRLSSTTHVAPASGIQGADSGIAITVEGSPFPILLVQGGDKFVVGISKQAVEAALSPSSTLSDNASFKTAASALSGVDPTFFVDIQPILTLADGLGASNDPDFAQARSYLEQFGAVAAGSKRDGDTYRAKLVVTLK